MSASPAQAETIAALRRQLAGLHSAPTANVLPFGDARIDAHLPSMGLPIGQLHEIGAVGIEVETGAIAGAFAAALTGALAALTPDRVLLWIAPCCDLYGPGLLQYGVDPARLILVRTDTDDETLGAMETALRSGAAAVVLGEIGRLSRIAARRLQLACLTEGTTAFALRRWPHGRKPAPPEGNAAATRWRLRPAPSAEDRQILGPPCWQVELTHARGGRPGAWIMQRPEELPTEEKEDEDAPRTTHPRTTHPLRVVAVLGDDTAAPRPREIGRATG